MSFHLRSVPVIMAGLLLTLFSQPLLALEGPPVGCSITIGAVSVTPESCPGGGDGSVTIPASCDNCADELEYSVDGINFQAGNTFTGLAAGDHTLTVREAGGATCFEEASFTVAAGVDSEAPTVARVWTFTDRIVAANATGPIQFGSSVAKSGNYAIVGAPKDSHGGEATGAAYLFTKTASGWVQQAKLTAPDGVAGDDFGSSVGINGDYIVVGAPHHETGPTVDGAAYVFVRSGNTWVQSAKLTEPEGSGVGAFGASVAITEARVIVGAYTHDTPSSGAGAAYVFELENQVWTQTAKLQPLGNPNSGGFFGYDVAIDGDYALVGALNDNAGSLNGGAAYVFRKTESGWEQQTRLLPSNIQAYAQVGNTVAIKGPYAVIGAGYIFKRMGQEWTQQAQLIPDGGYRFSSGANVAMDSSTIVVATITDDEMGVDAGTAYVYSLKGGAWSFSNQIFAPDAADYARFGSGVAVDSQEVFVGAYTAIENGAYQGVSYFFNPTSRIDPDTLSFCGTSVTASPPTITDNCAGQVTGATTDPVTFDTVGTYSIDWTFDDGNGNVTTANQIIEIVDRTVTIASLETTSVSCPGESDGTITVEAICADCPGGLEYSIDGANFQSSNTFTGLAVGTYSIIARAAGSSECTAAAATGTVAEPAPEAPTLNSPTIAIDWVEELKVISGDDFSNDYYGRAVDIHGRYAIVGSSNTGAENEETGAARIYRRVGDAWVEQADLRPSAGTAGDGFGTSVAIYGDYAVVGASWEDTNGDGAGRVYVFRRTTADTWEEHSQFTASGISENDNFGSSVDINGNYIVVGAERKGSGHTGTGAAYVYRLQSSVWVEDTELQPESGQDYRYIGQNVAIDGEDIIVSATRRIDGGGYHGVAFTYHLQNDQTWAREATLTSSRPASAAYFAYSTAIHHGTAVVGAVVEEGEPGNGVFVYERSAQGDWSEQAFIGPPPTSLPSNGGFGISVGIHGDDLIIGDNSHDTNEYYAGAAYTYHRIGTDWVNTKTLLASDRQHSEQFGVSVALGDEYALIGAYADESDRQIMGSAYFFRSERQLQTDTLSLCGDPATAISPTATNKCGFLITGTTDDPTTFDTVGTHTVAWTFDDGNGNVTTANQVIEVVDYTVTIASLETTPVSCPGGSDGTIMVEASCVDCSGSLEYSINGTNFQAANTFTELAPGDYTLTIQEKGEVTCIEEVEFKIAPGTDDELPFVSKDWEQAYKTLTSGQPASGQRDYTVAVHDNYAVVGARLDETEGVYGGAAYVFHFDGNEWTEEFRLVPSDLENSDYFGSSVAIYDQTIIIGSHGDNEGGFLSGAAYVFDRNNDGWQQSAKLVSTHADPYDEFGKSVSVWANRVVVGAHQEGPDQEYTGAVHVFELENDDWVNTATFQPKDIARGDRFGSSVDIHGDYIAVGAIYGNEFASQKGAAYIFHHDGTDWVEQAKLNGSTTGRDDKFGTSIAIDGGRVVVGSQLTNRMGAAYVFDRTGSVWTETAVLHSSDQASYDQFGYSVDVLDDRAIVGAIQQSAQGDKTGAAYIFRKTDQGWVEEQRLNADDQQTRHYLGWGVALSKSFALVSARPNFSNTDPAGAAYFYRSSPIVPADILTLCNDPVTVPTPTVTDNCAGTVTGTTDDPTTFSAEGTYSIDWTFDDGNGNVIVANQTVNVYDEQADITSVVSTPPSCPGQADGTLTVTATCSSCPDGFQYSIDGLNYQSGNVFTGLAAADYTIYVREPNSLCVSTATTTLDESEDMEAPVPAVPAISGWAQAYKALMSDGESNDMAGHSVAILDSIAIVGAPADDTDANDAGAAYVFKRTSTGWTEWTKLVAGDPGNNAQFGHSIAISDQFAVIGARGKDTNGSNAGGVYVFSRTATGFAQQAILLPTDGEVGDKFGAAVAISGNYLFAGAPEADNEAINMGAAYVFEWNGTKWTEKSKFFAPNRTDYDQFGYSVAMHGEYAVVGAPTQDDKGMINIGVAHVYKLTGSNWTFDQTLTGSDALSGDYFGGSVAISNDYIAVGAHLSDEAGTNSGAVYIFHRSATQWTEEIKLIPTADIKPYGNFGWDVAISNDYLAISASADDGVVNNAGALYLYKKTATGWTQKQYQKLTAKDGTINAYFGFGVALSDDQLIIGAPRAESNTVLTGAAYFFQPKLATDTLLYCGAPVTAPTPTATDDCAGTVTGTTDDATTFTTAGTYTITWTFDDGNGNTTVTEQTIEVIAREVTIASVETTDPSCPGESDGTISVTASCNDCTGAIQYSLNGIVYQPGNTFTGLNAGNYTVYARGNSGLTCVETFAASIKEGADDIAPVVVDGTSDWKESRVLSTDGGDNQAYFSGRALSIDGNTLAAGRPEGKGTTYIFQQNADGEWQQTSEIVPDGTVNSQHNFGTDVDLLGSYLVVGAQGDNTNGNYSGAAYIFERDGSGKWQQISKLLASDGGTFDFFGGSVAITDDYVAVGASRETTKGGNAGTVYLFKRNNSGSWQEVSRLHGHDTDAGDFFGSDLAFYDDLLVVGASQKETDGAITGAAYVFKLDDAENWIQQAKLLEEDLTLSASFGSNVDIEGNKIIVGAALADVDGRRNKGAAYIFEADQTGTWQRIDKLQASDGDSLQQFGYSVAISQNLAIVGARFAPGGGAAYLYSLNETGKYEEVRKFQGTDLGLGDEFGSVVAVDEDDILVGARANSGPDEGGLFSFKYKTFLLPDTLTYCGIPVTAPTPTATDDCAGTVTGTTNDATTFTATGTYTITWTFDDGSGNVTTAEQSITVLGAVLPLPIVEGFEETSLTRSCWTINDVNDDGAWYYESDDDNANSGRYAAVLGFNYDRAQDDQLISPAFAATPGIWYNLSFHFARAWTLTGHLRVVLLNADDNSEVKQLFYSKDMDGWFAKSSLLFDVPGTGNYRIAFESDTPTGGSDLRLDDIEISAFTLPTDGAAALVDPSDDACATYHGYGMNGYAWTRYMSRDGSLLMEMDANGNDLGDVILEMVDHSGVPLTPYLGLRQLSRHFNIIPANGPGPYTVNGGVKIRLYYTVQELLDYNDFLSENNGWGDLVVSHYSGVNQDCSLENSTDPEYTFELLTNEGDFGGTAHYLEFTTQSFSEFGATTDQAAPVVLTEFTAREDGPVNRLAWTVASEIDFSHYEVQRSTTGTDFVAFAEVAGRQLTDYASSDPAPAPLTYYRLKMVDYDETYAYSPVVSVNRKQNAATALQAYPVPSTNRVTLRFNVLRQGEHHLTLSDALGRTVSTQTFHAPAGAHERPIELGGLATGTYQLVLKASGETRSVRIVKN